MMKSMAEGYNWEPWVLGKMTIPQMRGFVKAKSANTQQKFNSRAEFEAWREKNFGKGVKDGGR